MGELSISPFSSSQTVSHYQRLFQAGVQHSHGLTSGHPPGRSRIRTCNRDAAEANKWLKYPKAVPASRSCEEDGQEWSEIWSNSRA